MKTLCIFLALITLVVGQYQNCYIQAANKTISLAPLYLKNGEYITNSGAEKFFLNICGDAETVCKGKKYPTVHSYDKKCGYLGVRYFKTRLIDSRDASKGGFITYPNGINQNGVKSNAEIKIVYNKKGPETQFRYIKHRYEGNELFFEFLIETRAIKEFHDRPTNPPPPVNCKYRANGASFDLSPLYKHDSEYEHSSGFEKFFWNVCGDAKTKCENKAYPITNDYFGTCGHLGTLDTMKFELLDTQYPQKGVKQTYLGGSNGGVTSNTEISHFCKPGQDVPTSEYVRHRYENDTFIFEFKTTSKYACPLKQ
eukprot:gene4308-7664_t